jgi:hypothetical protein
MSSSNASPSSIAWWEVMSAITYHVRREHKGSAKAASGGSQEQASAACVSGDVSFTVW